MPTLSRRTAATPAVRVMDGSHEHFWPTEWLLWETPPTSAVHNMAADLTLLRRAAASGRAVLRLYEWERPTLSFGRNEVARGRWDLQALEAAGIDLVRRPTGGRALLHAPEVTWSVTLPLADDVPWRRVYDAVNARLLRALHRAGLEASLVTDVEAPRVTPDGPLCFDAPAGGELTLDGRKLAGSAVWRADGGYLQHGSILLRDVQAVLTAFRLPPAAADQTSESLHSSSSAGPRASLTGDAAAPTLHDASADTLREAIRAEWCGARAVPDKEGDVSNLRDIPIFEPSPEHIAAGVAARQELSCAEWLWRR